MSIPRTPVEFDYDLWTTAEGKCMVRIKATGEITEVERSVMQVLHKGHDDLTSSPPSSVLSTAVSLECSCVATNNKGCARCGT